MSRGSALSTALVVLPAVRLAVDATSAAVELVDRFGLTDARVSRQAGPWELDAEVSVRRIGLGVLVEHVPSVSPVLPESTLVEITVGPLTLSAHRSREASLVWALPDCTFGSPTALMTGIR